MKKQNEKEYKTFLEQSNIQLKTYFNIADFLIPTVIDICNIKSDNSYLLNDPCIYYKVRFENKDFYTGDEKSPQILYGKFKDLDNSYQILSILYDFIDNKTIMNENGETVLQILKLATKKKFCSFFLHSGIICFDDLIKIYNELLFYVEKVKKMFIENMNECLDFNKKFPAISLKPKEGDIPKDLLKKASYVSGMADIQSVIEFGGSIIFKENVGKAYEDWSWREQYLRKMYLDLKGRTDEYIELLKAKQLET